MRVWRTWTNQRSRKIVLQWVFRSNQNTVPKPPTGSCGTGAEPAMPPNHGRFGQWCEHDIEYDEPIQYELRHYPSAKRKFLPLPLVMQAADLLHNKRCRPLPEFLLKRIARWRQSAQPLQCGRANYRNRKPNEYIATGGQPRTAGTRDRLHDDGGVACKASKFWGL